MTEEKLKGKELILMAFGAVGIVIVLQTIYQKLVFDSFQFKSLLSLVIAAFLCLRVILKNEWAKYGAMIWALVNIAICLKLAFSDKIYFYVFVAGVFCFLVAVLSFSKSVDSYLSLDDDSNPVDSNNPK